MWKHGHSHENGPLQRAISTAYQVPLATLPVPHMNETTHSDTI